MGSELPAILMIALMVLGVLVAVLWFFLPFAVFGIKPLLTSLSSDARRRDDAIIIELKAIRTALEARTSTAAPEPPVGQTDRIGGPLTPSR